MHLPPRHATSTAPQSALSSTWGQLTRGLRLSTLLVADCLIDTENKTAGLGSGLESVNLDKSRLPDESLHHVGNTFILEVDTSPCLALAVLDTELVEDVGSIEASVVAKLAGNDLEGLGERLDDGLLFVRDVLISELVKVC
jgi:hypothetical protein